MLAGLAAATLAFAMLGPARVGGLGQRLAIMLSQSQSAEPGAAVAAAAAAIGWTVAPLLLAVLAATVAATLGQSGFLIRPEWAQPDLSRLNPARGLRRLFGAAPLFEPGKSLLKLLLVSALLWGALDSFAPSLAATLEWDPAHLLDGVARAALRVMFGLLAGQTLIAAVDFVLGRWKHARGLRMSRQDMRDEQKESDGDPRVKARIKQLRRQRARRRMLAAVPKATVVITNPTHYAVALAYEKGGSGAPRVVAKGVDEVAARIREVAAAHRVPLVANPPLARALYPVEIDGEIPAEHFKAVAEIIAYVWRLSTRAARPA